MRNIIKLLSDSRKTDLCRQRIGAIEKNHACMILTAEYSEITLSNIQQAGSCVLELDELHSTAEGSFSYLILVNDQVVYQRTMEPMSNSVCPCLVKLRLEENDRISLRLIGGTVNFTDIFLHTDLDYVLEHYQEPMEIGLCFPRPTYMDRAADLARMCKIRDDFADLKHFTVAIGVEVKYMQVSNAQLKEQFDYILGLAREARVNLIFNFNSWWDGTPAGRDGKGGYFSDLEYHQIVYDPITGKKMLSVPNLWRNTPWYTMNHDHLNRVRKVRLASALDILGARAADLKLEREFLPGIRILIDNEPTYWAEFAYSSSPEAGGDFNEHAVRAAAKDGVDLNPSGELKHEQKLWLLHNLCTYMTDISETYHACTSSEYAVVAFDRVSYGDHHLTENVMTHVQTYAGHPYADERYMRHEEHVNPYTRLGIETCGHQDERALSYLPATGRYAQVNAERCCYTDPAFHHQFYAHGAFCDIIFNFFYDTDVEHLHRLDHLEDEFMLQQTCGTEVMRFSPYDGRLTDRSVVSAENMEIGPLRERRVLRPGTLGQGSITFALGAASQYPHGGWVELKGLIRPLNGTVTAELGTDCGCLTDIQVLPERDADYQIMPLRIPMDTLLSRAKADDTVYLKLTFENLYYDDWAQMNSIWEVRGVAAFETHKTAVDPRLTLPQARALSLLISYRNDCDRLREQYPAVSVPEADDYKMLYQKLMHRISVHCTSKFIVNGSGYLEKYQMHVDSCDAVIRLELEEEGDDLIATLHGDHGSQISLSMDGWKLKAHKLTQNRYLLQKEVPMVQQSVLTLSVSAAAGEAGVFEGTFLGYDSQHNEMEVCTHDPAWGYQAVMQLVCPADVPVDLIPSQVTGNMLDHISTNPYTPAAIINARIDSEPTVLSLNRGDKVTCKVIGNQITEIQAVRGLARGRILSVQPLSMEAPMHNAFLTLETAPGQTVTFELGMNTHLNYQRAHADNPILAGDLPLELAPNNIVLISFEPETVEGRPCRALEVTMV